MTLLRTVAEYYLRDACKLIMWVGAAYIAIIITIMLFLGIATLTPETPDDYTIIQSANYDEFYVIFNISGSEFVFLLALFIVCASYFKEYINFFLQHGISRRTAFAGFVLNLFIVGAVYVVAALLANIITSIILFSQTVNLTMMFDFSTAYHEWLDTVGTAYGFLIHLLWVWALFFAIGAIGYFLAALFNRLNNLGMILLGAGILFVLMLNNRIGNPIGQFLSWLILIYLGLGSGDFANPLNSIGFLLVLSAIALGCSWLFVRSYQVGK